jgi:hypothetical protein
MVSTKIMQVKNRELMLKHAEETIVTVNKSNFFVLKRNKITNYAIT